MAETCSTRVNINALKVALKTVILSKVKCLYECNKLLTYNSNIQVSNFVVQQLLKFKSQHKTLLYQVLIVRQGPFLCGMTASTRQGIISHGDVAVTGNHNKLMKV
jgi:hypothetical protein